MANPWDNDPIVSPSAPSVQVRGADPKLPLEVRGAQLNNEGTAIGNKLKLRELDEPRMLGGANEGFMWDPRQRKAVPIPGVPNKAVMSAAQKAEILRDAKAKIDIANRMAKLSKNGWFATGFLAPTMSNFGGTNATNVKDMAGVLQSGGALTDILKMAAQNGGKNPLTPMSNSDVQLIANKTGNLDIGQSDDEFQKQVDAYRQAYQHAYVGAGGRPADIGMKPQSGPRVIRYDANGNRVP